MEQLASGQKGSGSGGGSGTRSEGPVKVDIETPSSRMRTFEARNGGFSIRYPDNWEAQESRDQNGVTIAPRNGVVAHGNEQAIVYGVIVSTFDPQSSSRSQSQSSSNLDEVTGQLVDQVLKGNQYLREVSGSERRETIDGSRGKSLVLSGRSPVTGEDEQVTLVTTFLRDGRVLYTLFIAPRKDNRTLGPVFRNMMSSLRLEAR